MIRGMVAALLIIIIVSVLGLFVAWILENSRED